MPRYQNRNAYPVENLQEKDEDSWAQTLITITPEDDAVLREIKTKIPVSAKGKTSLDLNTDSFIYRRPLTPKYLVNIDELEDENIAHAQVQTYLQGLSVVDIPIKYKDQISQTLYMSTPCPTVKYYKDIMTSMRDGPIPEFKNTRAIQTKLTFHPNTKIQIVTERLKIDINQNELIKDFLWNEEDYSQFELNALISDILYHLQERTFWILDPTSLTYPVTVENDAQTLIKYDLTTDKIVIDNETQTELTCEPKLSNTELLTDYQANKNLVYDILNECFDKAVETRILVDDIIDEVIEKGVEIVRYPPRDQNIQTLASYKVDEKKEDVLRKLQLTIVVDPLESSIVVLQIIDDLLKSICEIVFNDARQIVQTIIRDTINKSINIGFEIEKIRNNHRSNDKLIEQILDKRRKKIAKLMAKKKTMTVFTQTSISGIREVTKLEKLIETYSCICLKHSKCYICNSVTKDQHFKENLQMLRTQDILLAYRPCNVVNSSFDIEFDRVSTSSTEEKSITSNRIQFSSESSSGSVATINVALKPKERISIKDSIDEWAHAIDAALTIPWSSKSSLSETDRTKGSKNKLTLQTMRILQILKSTFCIRDTCPMSVVEKLKQKSCQEVDEFNMNSSCDTYFCLKNKDFYENEENVQDQSNIMDYKIDNISFENDNCFCHISYALNTLDEFSKANHSSKLKIIPIQFNS
ncbi:uncharacterized protein LOC122513193 [Polistes fuscatus]|uniref:uncharacterized protein LOC122513193 n=1 Tax=Polistes fuscatus TaxID=30207 RepID=UPI001CA9C968|nr:uncharacterized protein LOC122513193 [Polistes fuscatus]